MEIKLYQFISNLTRRGSIDATEETADYLSRNGYLPSGSGFDNGTQLDTEKSNPQKLVFKTAFHHLSQHGFYTKWTDHTVTVTPSFYGINIKVSGRDHNGIKDYIAECFDSALNETVSDELRQEYMNIVRSN